MTYVCVFLCMFSSPSINISSFVFMEMLRFINSGTKLVFMWMIRFVSYAFFSHLGINGLFLMRFAFSIKYGKVCIRFAACKNFILCKCVYLFVYF